MQMTSGTTFTGNSGLSYTASATAVTEVGGADVALALKNGWVPVPYPSPIIDNRILQLPKWRNAINRVRAGTGRGRLMLLGDSTTTGAGAGASGNFNLAGALAKSRGAELAARLATLGIPTSFNSVISDGQVTQNGVTCPAYDPRCTL